MYLTKKLTLASAILTASGYTLAAGLGQQSQIDEVVVVGAAANSITALSASQAVEELKKIPGGIGLVKSDDFLNNFTQSIGDALQFTPGVYADTSAQRENRISIRGSGLNATFERRGITVLRDGVPISRASGITEFQEVDPLSIDYIEIYKGSNGLRYGAASLGGAINIVTPTGATSDPETSIRLEGGSFDTRRASINTRGQSDNVDYYGAVTKLDSDGYRDHAEVDSIYSFGNVGISINDSAETRFYFTALQDDFELAGSLTLDDALNDPRQAQPQYIIGDFDRNLDVYRISNKTSILFDSAKLQLGSWFANRKLDHAITPFAGIIDQNESEAGFSLELSGTTEMELPMDWVLGAYRALSANKAKIYDYRDRIAPPPFISSSVRGDLISHDDQDASNTVIYGQLDMNISDALNLLISTQYVKSVRKNDNIFNSEPDDAPGGPNDDSGKLTFEELSHRIGLLYTTENDTQFYFNYSDGYEPPGITDLTSGGVDDFTELEAQSSSTIELGSRGNWSIAAWDFAVYRSKLENEFIDNANPASAFAPAITENSPTDTVHQGLELGLDLRFFGETESKDISLIWRNTYTFNDFEFDNDPTRGDNKLAGIPEHIYITELSLSNENWYTSINLRHIANGAYADYDNTTQAPGYELLGLTAGYQITPEVRFFGSIDNLLDEEYVSNVSTTFGPAPFSSNVAGSSLFTPGEGRAFYIGVNLDLQID